MYSESTKCLHAGYHPKSGEPRQVPIYNSTTFKYDTCEDMGKLFDLEASGYFYSRLQNPTCDIVAARIAALEGGTAAMLTSSGMSAMWAVVATLCKAGDHIVSSSSVYGGTFNLLATTLKKFGIETTFVRPDATEDQILEAIKPNTKFVFGESISNPELRVLDFEKFAKCAHSKGIPLVVDNTFPTPIMCRPFEWGVDIITHSTTKYMDGHASSIGGVVVDSGNFNWMEHADKFPDFVTPDESYHGVSYYQKFGQGAAFITKATAQCMRDFGICQSPFSAYILNLGLESLAVRMERHCNNALEVASYLKHHSNVEWVNYPHFTEDRDLVLKYMPNGTCGVISFGVKGGRQAAMEVMKKFKLISIETHVADSITCCLHPASTTHRQLTDEELTNCGVLPNMIRLSVGLEGVSDIISDLTVALG